MRGFQPGASVSMRAQGISIADLQRALEMAQPGNQQRARMGYDTPIRPEPMTYFGRPPEQPVEERTGQPLLSESMLSSLRQASTVSNALRPAADSIFRPAFTRTALPLSSLAAPHAEVTNSLALPMAPLNDENPVQRVADAIESGGAGC